MVTNTYKNGMLDIIGALSGTFLCVKFSQKIEIYSKYIKKIIIFIGRNSLICLCVHLVSLNCLRWNTLNRVLMQIGIQNETIRATFLNIMWCIIILIIIKFISRVYSLIKKKVVKNIA